MTRMPHNSPMKHSILTVAALLGCAALLAATGCRAAKPVEVQAAAVAPVAPVAPPPPDPSLTPDEFARAVVYADLLELKLGGMAQSRCQAVEVKEYAKRMVVNHTAIEAIMTRVAEDAALTLPTTTDPADAAVIAEFAALNGIAFDKAYMTLMVARHAKTLEMFRWQYDNCSDPTVKSFAVQTMPIIGVHSRTADVLNAEVNKEELAAAEAARVAAIAAAEAAKLEAAMAAAQAQADAQAKSKRGSKKSRAPKAVPVQVPADPAPSAAPAP